MLNQSLSIPLYEQLKNSIKEAIDAQVYKIGEKLPSEVLLEKKYEVSRITVRRAIKELCDEKILVRKQGKGTFILDHSKQNNLGKISGFHENMKKQDKVVSTIVLEKSIVKVKPSFVKYLKIDENDNVICLKRLMSVDEKPSFVDICYIPCKNFVGIYDKLVDNVSLFEIFKSDYKLKFGSFHKVLSVKKASEEIASLLGCHEGETIFNMFKVTYDEKQQPIYISINRLIAKDTSYVISSESQEVVSRDNMTWNT
ncbi:MAG: GntR family transcriptional regulator [Clostridia bacterium]